MNSDIKITWTVMLSDEEYRIVGLALSGKLAQPEDIEFAKALNVKMTRQRVAKLADMLKAAARRAHQAAGETDYENEDERGQETGEAETSV